MNEELASLYQADKQERVDQPRAKTPESKAMRIRDLQRRERVMAIAKSNGLQTAEDYYHAAQIMNHMNHGDTIDYGRCARWLSAAPYNRWQMYQGKPQNYGTNYIYDGRKDRLWGVGPETTDEEQKEFESNAPDCLEAILNTGVRNKTI